MNRKRQLPSSLLLRAEFQAGIFTKRQLYGSPDSVLTSAIAEGVCHRIQPGLYSLHPVLTAKARLWAGLLMGGPDASLGGDAARFALRGGSPPDVVDVWTSQSSRRDRGCWRFHGGQPPEDPDIEVDELNPVMGRLLTTSHLSPVQLAEQVERQLSFPARQRLVDLSTHGADDGCSLLETRWRNVVEQRHGLPTLHWSGFDAQAEHVPGAYGDGIVRVELRPCAPRGRSSWDPWMMGRSNGPRAKRMGDQVTLTIDWEDVVERPCEVAQEVSVLLLEAGSPHDPIPCDQCPHVADSAWPSQTLDNGCPSCGALLVPVWHLAGFPGVG